MLMKAVRLFLLLPLLGAAPDVIPAAVLTPGAAAAWEKYARLTETRIERDLQQETTAQPTGAVQIIRLRTLDDNGAPVRADRAMIHHWRGTILVPDANLDQVLKFVQDYDRHQQFFQEVEGSRLVSRLGDTFKIFYRLKRTKVITVVYNTEHSVAYRRHGPRHASSRSVATRIVEVDKPGTSMEQEKAAGQDHGFMWHLNSYWRFTERDGGVLVECESISLSRSIPAGLGWLVGGFVESVPRESLVNTLTSLRDGIKKK